MTMHVKKNKMYTFLILFLVISVLVLHMFTSCNKYSPLTFFFVRLNISDMDQDEMLDLSWDSTAFVNRELPFHRM